MSAVEFVRAVPASGAPPSGNVVYEIASPMLAASQAVPEVAPTPATYLATLPPSPSVATTAAVATPSSTPTSKANHHGGAVWLWLLVLVGVALIGYAVYSKYRKAHQDDNDPNQPNLPPPSTTQ